MENKIPDHAKYITTQKFNNLTAQNFAARLKQANLVSKINFHNKLISFNKNITSNKTKYLEIQKNGPQNMFVYQQILGTLELKKDKKADNVLSWKSKGVFNSTFKPLYTAFLHSIKLSEYKMGITFDKDPLAVEQNKSVSTIVNVYIVYDLDAWPRNPTNNFKFKTCSFGATSVVKK